MKASAGIVCGVIGLAVACAALAQAPAGGMASAGVYSAAQAARGADLYAANCARCHGASKEGLDVAPPLTGPRFLGNWTSQSVGALAARIRTSMPLDMPGTLGLTASAELAADILAANGYPAGPADMATGSQALQQLTIDAPPAR